MGGVDAPLDGLRVVRLLVIPRDVPVALGHSQVFEVGQFRPQVPGAHVGPADAPCLDDRVADELDLLLERALVRLGRHVDALAGDVVLPAVVGAAQTVLLVASEEEVCPAVRAVALDEPHAARGVAESEQRFSEEGYAHRLAVGLGKVGRLEERHPETADELAGGGSRPDSRQLLVLCNG